MLSLSLPSVCLSLFVSLTNTQSHTVAQASLKLVILPKLLISSLVLGLCVSRHAWRCLFKYTLYFNASLVLSVLGNPGPWALMHSL